jgi:hypothetical protein
MRKDSKPKNVYRKQRGRKAGQFNKKKKNSEIGLEAVQ